MKRSQLVYSVMSMVADSGMCQPCSRCSNNNKRKNILDLHEDITRYKRTYDSVNSMGVRKYLL